MRVDSLSYSDVGAKKATAQEAATAFEGYLVETMIKEMRKTVPEGILSSSAMSMFAGMLDAEIAHRIAEAGMGLADRIAGQLPADGSAPAAVEAAHLPRKVRLPGGRSGGGGDGWEMPVVGRITSRFGHRSDPIEGDKRMHKGLDIAAPQGTPIHPARPGTVVRAGDSGGKGGNVVTIDHGDGTRSIYAHCHTINVKPGQQVGRGDVIATVGSTGRSTGPHLHLEIHRDGQAQDPAEFLGLERH